MPSMEPQVFHPIVLWAQREDVLYVTIEVDDCDSPEIDITETSLHFKGKGGADKKIWEVKLEFHGEVNPKESKFAVLSRNIPMVLRKNKDDAYWPRLLKDKVKPKWLQTDWNKWKDEDDSDAEGGDPGLDDMMSQMGGFPGGMGGGMPPGMGGMGGMPGMGGMGGMPGMGGMGGMPPGMAGMPGMDGMGDDFEADSDDEELPDLEGGAAPTLNGGDAAPPAASDDSTPAPAATKSDPPAAAPEASSADSGSAGAADDS